MSLKRQHAIYATLIETNEKTNSNHKEINENKENAPSNKIILKKTSKCEQIEEELREEQELKFKYAAIVMDRFFLCLALIYALATFVALIFSDPNLFKS